MITIKELPFAPYEGQIVKKTHVLEDSCVVWDALNGPSELGYWEKLNPKERAPENAGVYQFQHTYFL